MIDFLWRGDWVTSRGIYEKIMRPKEGDLQKRIDTNRKNDVTIDNIFDNYHAKILVFWDALQNVLCCLRGLDL